MAIKIPEGACTVMGALEAAGHSVFLVGGCVRDSLRGVSPTDWDIATSARPEAMLSVFSGYTVIPTGLKHGTVTVLVEGTPYEVTTYRMDGSYSDHRRPDTVSFTDDITADLARRDFTINAMAYRPATGLLDPFGGAADLTGEVVRCVGDPHRRFEEDALRILRAARFASRLNFVIEDDTLAAMVDKSGLVGAISAERIFSELRQALVGPGFGRVFGPSPFLLKTVIPEMGDMVNFPQNTPYHIYTVYEHTVRAVEAAPPDLTVRLALLLHDIAKPRCRTVDAAGIDHFKGHADVSAAMADAILQRLRCDNKLRQDVCALIAHHSADVRPDDRSVRRWLGRLGEVQLRRLVAVKAADNAAKAPDVQARRKGYAADMTAAIDRVVAEGQAFSLGQLAIGGNDLIALGVAPGPGIGELLHALLDRVIEGELPNEHAALLAEVKRQME